MVKDNSMSDNISSDLIYILDKSGSMAGSGDEPKQALNGSILEQKAVPGSENSTYSIYTFSDKVTLSVDDRKLSDAVEFEDYKPDGMTALNDAICIAIKNKLAKPNHKNVIVTVITDGHENASKDYTNSDAKKMIKAVQDDHGWKIIFLGATQSVIEGGVDAGVDPRNCAVYDQNTPGGLLGLARAVSSQVAEYRSAGAGEMSPKGLDIRSLSTPARDDQPDSPVLVRSTAPFVAPFGLTGTLRRS